MPLDWRSKLIHSQAAAPSGFRSLATPTYRGSTTLFDRVADAQVDWDQTRAPYGYGLHGTPTTLELAARVAELEGGGDCLIVPNGQAAIALVYFAFAGAGAHVLLPEGAYRPSGELADRVLARFGVETEVYDPLIGGGIAELIRPNTRLVWCESPCSVTMEVQDVPAITAAARRADVVTALDNTYSAGVLFEIERAINGKSPADCRAVRQEHSAPLVANLETWMRAERAKLSRHNDVAKAMDYMLNRWTAFTRFLTDGRICLSNNAAERALRTLALGRRSWLFAGSDRGGQRAAMMYSLVTTAKMNNVDPQAWLADILARIANHPAAKIDELMPWNWAPQPKALAA